MYFVFTLPTSQFYHISPVYSSIYFSFFLFKSLYYMYFVYGSNHLISIQKIFEEKKIVLNFIKKVFFD